MSAADGHPELKQIGMYDLLEKIAVGGMGAVYRGRHQNTGDIVAIKIVPPTLTKNEILLKRFQQEFRVARNLNHPNIVRALDFGNQGESYYLAMEYIDGESLGERIEREGPMKEAAAIKIMIQAAMGLHVAHQQGLIHRDIKPDNVLIARDGTAKIADLGLAKELQVDTGLTRTGRGLGTPHFMSPEQFRDAKRVGIRSDIYSLGATLYMAVTGDLPYRSLNPWDAWTKKMSNDLAAPREIIPGISERVDWAIRRAMSADAEKRPASCLEFIEDITGKRPPTVTPEGGAPESSKWWYLYYTNPAGVPQTVKGTLEAIRLALQEKQLGDPDGVRAARSKAGPFEALKNFPEFRDLLISPAALAAAVAKIDPEATEPLESLSPSKATLTPMGSNPIVAPPIKPASVAHMVLPEIHLSSAKKKDSIGWATWVIVILLAVASAVVTYYWVNQ